MGPSVDTSHLYVPSARAVTFLNRTRPPNVPLLHSSFKITRQENNNQKSRRKETEMKGAQRSQAAKKGRKCLGNQKMYRFQGNRCEESGVEQSLRDSWGILLEFLALASILRSIPSYPGWFNESRESITSIISIWLSLATL